MKSKRKQNGEAMEKLTLGVKAVHWLKYWGKRNYWWNGWTRLRSYSSHVRHESTWRQKDSLPHRFGQSKWSSAWRTHWSSSTSTHTRKICLLSPWWAREYLKKLRSPSTLFTAMTAREQSNNTMQSSNDLKLWTKSSLGGVSSAMLFLGKGVSSGGCFFRTPTLIRAAVWHEERHIKHVYPKWFRVPISKRFAGHLI